MKIDEVNYEDVLKIRHEVMYPEANIDLAKIENDHEAIHLGVYAHDTIVSVVSIFLKNREVQFRKLATKKEYQHNNYGSALVKYIIEYYKQFDFNRLWANSRVEVLPFYEKLGFKSTDQTFSKNGHDYVIIEYKNE